MSIPAAVRWKGPECGHATQALAALGHEPGDIGRVIFTHLHGDHCGGFLDGLGATATEIVLSRAEAEYWRGASHPASRVLAQASGRLVLVEDGDTVDAGLTVWALPGHTPGHTGLIIDGEAALLGDCVHLPALQLADPMIATKYDDDTALAQRTRVAALMRLADEGLAFGGGHIADAAGTPAFLRIMAERAGFVAVAP
ncbi:MAG: MBL fold metallo-hydrolase [Paracoccaceae bacterium]